MVVIYILLIFISSLFLGFYAVLKKKSLEKSSALETLFFYCFFATIFSLIFFKDIIHTSFENIGLIAIKSLLILLNWFLVAKAMEKLSVGVVTSFSLLSTIITVISSHFVFHENLSYLHLISGLFIGGGIIVLSIMENKNNPKEKESNLLSFLYLIISSVLGTLTYLLDKFYLDIRGIKPGALLFYFLLFCTIGYLIIYLIKNKKIAWKVLKTNYWLILLGLSIVISDLTYYESISLKDSNLSIISILRKFNIIIATVLSSIFFKEKKLISKLLIMFFMLFGFAIPVIFK